MLNETAIRGALEQQLNNTNVTDSMVSAVKGYVQAGLYGGQCNQASSHCLSGQACPTPPPCPTCPTCPAPVVCHTCPQPIQCPHSAAPALTPTQYVAGALVVATIYMTNQDAVDDVVSGVYDSLKSGIGTMVTFLRETGVSEEKLLAQPEESAQRCSPSSEAQE